MYTPYCNTRKNRFTNTKHTCTHTDIKAVVEYFISKYLHFYLSYVCVLLPPLSLCAITSFYHEKIKLLLLLVMADYIDATLNYYIQREIFVGLFSCLYSKNILIPSYLVWKYGNRLKIMHHRNKGNDL